MIKTYRGLLADGGQDRLRLQTIRGKVGYRVIKFQLMPEAPHDVQQVSVVQVWKSQQDSVPTSGATINFSDSDILAASVGWFGGLASNISQRTTTIFDQEIVNQDIYLTHTDQASNQACNYYLELEVIPLDDVAAEYTTLKDMRQP